MDVKEYIASGVVELYAMNALPNEEKKEFERHMLLYPELSDELRLVSHALERYADDQSLNPRPQLRIKIVGVNGQLKPVVVVKQEEGSGKTSSVLAYKYLIAASLAALVISTFASWFFYSRWEEAEDRYTNLLDDKNELAESYNLVKLTYDENLTKMFVIRDPATQMFELRSADTSSHYLARVYWNRENHKTYIDMLILPEPGEGRQYQLWAMNGEEKIDAGVCTTDRDGMQQVKDVEMVSDWWLSLEQKGSVAIAPSYPVISSR